MCYTTPIYITNRKDQLTEWNCWEEIITLHVYVFLPFFKQALT